MAKYSVNQKVRYRKDSGATTYTGVIKGIVQAQPARYSIRPEGASGAQEVVVGEDEIFEVIP